jgi:hypothetical protein
MAAIPLGSLRQEDHMLEVSLNYIARPCLNKPKIIVKLYYCLCLSLLNSRVYKFTLAIIRRYGVLSISLQQITRQTCSFVYRNSLERIITKMNELRAI